MKIKLNNKEYLWMVIGALILLVVILVALHFQAGQKSVTQLAFKARRLDLVAQMRLDLASASEAEKSAVLAITDQESKNFADQARVKECRLPGSQKCDTACLRCPNRSVTNTNFARTAHCRRK